MITMYINTNQGQAQMMRKIHVIATLNITSKRERSAQDGESETKTDLLLLFWDGGVSGDESGS